MKKMLTHLSLKETKTTQFIRHGEWDGLVEVRACSYNGKSYNLHDLLSLNKSWSTSIRLPGVLFEWGRSTNDFRLRCTIRCVCLWGESPEKKNSNESRGRYTSDTSFLLPVLRSRLFVCSSRNRNDSSTLCSTVKSNIPMRYLKTHPK